MPQRTQRRSGGSSRRSGGGRPRPSGRGSKPAPKKSYANIEPLHPTLDPPDIESFAEFDLGEETQKAIADMGITKPTPIQALAIQPVLKGKDVIAKAETGTGKTLAFGAPMMSKIDPGRSTVLGLVLSPTRELAEQVHDVLEKLGQAKGVKTALVVGGEQIGPQVKALQAGAQVVVGTPGRVLDLLNQRFLQFPWTEFAVLDEADKMLEIGFIDDVKKILDACNEYRQTLLFSATFPPPLLELARGYTTDPAEIATASGVATVDTINQYVLRCDEDDRAKNLAHLLEDSAEDDVFLAFCERRTDVDRLMRQLERRRFPVKALHGGYDQAARFRVMGAFRTGEVKCLVATDVASRGLDVKHVTHVVNIGVPRDVSDYTHRIGRTGRAGRTGVAVTVVSRKDERRYRDLVNNSGFDIEEIERPRDLFVKERLAAKKRDGEDGDETEEREERPRKRRERKDRDEERPRRAKRRDRDDDDRPRRGKRRDREDEDRPRRSKRRDEEDRDDERPRRAKRRDRDDDERPRRRKRTSDDDSTEREQRPERRPRRRDHEDEEAPRRGRRERSETEASRDETPRAGGFGLGLEAAPEKPKRAKRARKDEDDGEERRPRRRKRSEEGSDDRPRKRRDRDDADRDRDEERPKKKRRPRSEDDERPKRRSRKSEDEGGKERSKGPKKGSGGENGRRGSSREEAPAPRSGGFGTGL